MPIKSICAAVLVYAIALASCAPLNPSVPRRLTSLQPAPFEPDLRVKVIPMDTEVRALVVESPIEKAPNVETIRLTLSEDQVHTLREDQEVSLTEEQARSVLVFLDGDQAVQKIRCQITADLSHEEAHSLSKSIASVLTLIEATHQGKITLVDPNSTFPLDDLLRVEINL